MRKTMFLIAVAVMLIVGVMPAMAQTSRASISLITPDYPVAVEATFDVVVMVNTGGEPIDAAAAYLNFDPTLFRVERITPGTALPIFLQSGMDNTAGTVNFAAGQLPPAYPSGEFVLATVTLRALAATDAGSITLANDFTRDTDVVAAGESVLQSAVGALITVSIDAPVQPENLNTVRSSAQRPGFAPEALPLPLAPSAEGIAVETLVAPVTIDGTAPNAWAAEGGWSLAVAADGSTGSWNFAAPEGSVSTASASLRLANPIDLSGVAVPQAAFAYTLAGSSVATLEARVAGGEWQAVATLAPAAELAVATADLAAFAGQTVEFRFAVENAAVGDAWSVGTFSVVAAPAE